MFRQVAIECKPLTHAVAKAFADLPTWKGDRDHKSKSGKKRSAWLRNKVIVGEFYSPAWSVVSVNGEEYRIDGSHSSAMLADLPPAVFPVGIDVIIRRFICADENEMAELFSQFDARKSLRTYYDKVKAHLAVEPSLESLTSTHTGMILSGIAFAFSNYENAREIEEDERAPLMHAYPEFVRWAARMSTKRFMRRASILAVMFSSQQHDSDAANKFWTLVAEDSHPDRNNATRELARFLLENFGRNNQQKTKKRWDPRAYAIKSILAWNAWRLGKTTTLIHHRNTPVPKLI